MLKISLHFVVSDKNLTKKDLNDNLQIHQSQFAFQHQASRKVQYQET